MKQAQIERELWADACRRDFWTFLLYGFGVKHFMEANPDKHWCTVRLHKPLADWYGRHIRDWLATRATRTRRKKLMIVWPRGFGKTTTITKAGNLWLHLQDPDLATAVDSVTQQMSEKFVGVIRDTLEGANPYAWFPLLYGNWVGARLWRNDALTHAMRRAHSRSEPSLEATSVDRGLTGKHPDALFIDDPVTREKLREGDSWLKIVDDHIDALIPVMPPQGLVVASATRYSDIDWLGRLMRDEGVRSIDGMQCRDPFFKLSANGQWDLFLMRARTDLGDPVLPEIWDAQALDDYERKNPYDFAAQMMNEPNEGEHMPVTREQIEHMYVDEKELPSNLRYSIHLDTAFKEREKAGRGDYSVICVWGHQVGTGTVYFVEGRRSNTWGASEYSDQLVSILQDYRMRRKQVFAITDETPAGKADTFTLYLMGACHAAGVPMPPFIRITQTTKKTTRIREAAMYWADGRVRLLRNAREVQHLVLEMLRLHGAHDDMADASASVFHPDVYTAERINLPGGTTNPIVRPWDEFLHTPTRLWTPEQAGQVYDADVEREQRYNPVEEAQHWMRLGGVD